MRARILAAFIVLCPGMVRAADAVKLVEPASDQRVFRVSVTMEVSGKQEVPSREDKPRVSQVSAKAGFVFEEQRLPGTGREAEAFRSVRHYDQAKAEIRSGDFDSLRTLRKGRRLIVSEGRREGARQFSPAGPMTYEELELLQFPGDTVALWSLLPDRAVEPGEIWKPSDWVLQYLAGIEATEKTAINCRLDSVTDGVARVEVTGDIRGADLGARCSLKISGFFLYDLAGKYLKHAEITHEDIRDGGALSPAFTLTAKSIVDRSPVETPQWLTAEALSGTPLEPTPGNLLLIFEHPEWGTRFYYDRQWHVFHQAADVAVLRMMNQGTFVAQFQIKVSSGRVSPEKLKAAIQQDLGEKLREFAQDEEVKTGTDLTHYRLVAVGELPRNVPRKASQKPEAKTTTVGQTKEGEPEAAVEVQLVPYQWMYNLLSAPDGRQALLTFIVEADQLERFNAQDAAILGNFSFLPKK